MRARTVIRAMEIVGEARGLPGSGQSGTEADDQEAWGEMEDEDAIKLLPDSQTPDTGDPGVTGCQQSLQPVQRGDWKDWNWYNAP